MEKPKSDPSVVIIGGGTGSFTLLTGFKKHTSSLTAVVNMADDGSSTGILRDELGVLPPGDIRRCLVALSDSPKVRELFEYRFDDGSLKGHAFGNIFLAALEKMTGSFSDAVQTAGEVLQIHGRVIPATLDDVRLRLSWPDKQLVLHGERVIDVETFRYDPRKATLSLTPHAKANPAALKAIEQADLVVIAPGDLYTSLGPILITSGMREALRSTKARVVYICNLVTEAGQTDGFDVSTHADEIERFIGEPVLDIVLYNTVMPTDNLLKKYAKVGEYWVRINKDVLDHAHYKSIGGDFVAHDAVGLINPIDPLSHNRTFIRHDADAVARLLLRR